MTAVMVNPVVSNHDGVHPDPLLRLVQPLHLELLLANRTHAVDRRRVLGHGDVLDLRSVAPPRFVLPLPSRIAAASLPVLIVTTSRARRRNRIHVDGFFALDPVHLVHVPAAVLAALLGVGHALVHAEVPVHVSRLGAAALLVGAEATAALAAGGTEVVVAELGEEVGAVSVRRRVSTGRSMGWFWCCRIFFLRRFVSVATGRGVRVRM